MVAYPHALGSVTVRTAGIGNFGEFVLSNIPYGEVDPRKNIQSGLVEFDGPLAPGFLTRPLLQWNFGGIAFPVTKAIKIDYSYTIWGTDTTAYAAILFGFQHGTLRDYAKANPKPVIKNEVGPATSGRSPNPKDPAKRRITQVQQQQQQLPDDEFTRYEEVFNLSPEIFTPLATSVITGTLGTNGAGGASSLVSVNGYADIDSFIMAQFPQDQQDAWNNQKKNPSVILLDGPAQDYHSHKPWVYTQQTLFNERDKYDQLLWWYFGGTARRVTKAIRIPLTPLAADPLSLFIGFAGPGDCPSGC